MYGRDTIHTRRKTLTFLHDKFTQDYMYQILSQSVRFCRLYIKKNISLCFFGLQCMSRKNQEREIVDSGLDVSVHLLRYSYRGAALLA